MKEKKPHFGPRSDFPVRQLLRTLVLGNMITAGGLYMLGVGCEILDNIHFYDLSAIPEGILKTISNFTEEILSRQYG